MSYSLIDTHCHLDIIEKEGLPISQTLDLSYERGVKEILQIGIDLASSKVAKEISETNHNIQIHFTAGSHPADEISAGENDSIERVVRENVSNPNFTGIGEIGLDFYHRKDTIPAQEEVFRRFLSLAAETNCPVIIHSRDAKEETYQILKDFKNKVFGVLHCFTYDLEYAMKFIELGYYISFSGIVVFKNAKDLQEAASKIPLSHLLIETDAPFLSPPPNRGKRNDPTNLPFILEKIFELREEKKSQIEETVFLNSQNFIQRKAPQYA
jgi:TatD DNase family protein